MLCLVQSIADLCLKGVVVVLLYAMLWCNL
jgi:hypothetical protein